MFNIFQPFIKQLVGNVKIQHFSYKTKNLKLTPIGNNHEYQFYTLDKNNEKTYPVPLSITTEGREEEAYIAEKERRDSNAMKRMI